MHKGINSTLDEGQTPVVARPSSDVVGSLCARDFKGVGSQYVNEGKTISVGMAVRRLTPVECERLQGFPDGYTNIPWRGKSESPDGPRYKALGNSWAVPVVRWIGERIHRAIA
jgi:site-specific DNA-cytosine methylase